MSDTELQVIQKEEEWEVLKEENVNQDIELLDKLIIAAFCLYVIDMICNRYDM